MVQKEEQPQIKQMEQLHLFEKLDLFPQMWYEVRCPQSSCVLRVCCSQRLSMMTQKKTTTTTHPLFPQYQQY
jgi:hypothetical protein